MKCMYFSQTMHAHLPNCLAGYHSITLEQSFDGQIPCVSRWVPLVGFTSYLTHHFRDDLPSQWFGWYQESKVQSRLNTTRWSSIASPPQKWHFCSPTWHPYRFRKFQADIFYYSPSAVCMESLVKICSADIENFPFNFLNIFKNLNFVNADFRAVLPSGT